VLLKIEGLSVAFGGLKAVNNVSFNVEQGEVSSIIGPNGAGKSTIFNLITGYIPCDSGKVYFNDEDITKLPSHIICRKGIGRSFQRSNIFPLFSSFDNVRIAVLGGSGKSLNFLSNAKKIALKETSRILEEVGLKDKAEILAGELSHGDQKRLEFGIALANNPQLVFLDEPTAGMSPEETVASMNLSRKLAKEWGIALVFVEHDMNAVFGYADKIRVLNRGTLIAEGTPKEIRENVEVQRIYLGEGTK
jgi:branched-chain amino acid transport system ATP-binding protein